MGHFLLQKAPIKNSLDSSFEPDRSDIYDSSTSSDIPEHQIEACCPSGNVQDYTLGKDGVEVEILWTNNDDREKCVISTSTSL